MKRLIGAALLLAMHCSMNAMPIDTLGIDSRAMKSKIETLVIVPADYDAANKEYPVLYLLNGHNGSHLSWLNIRPDLPEIATSRQMVIVCPHGNNSWYWDSPVDPSKQFETFVGSELVEYIDNNYSTRKDKSGRAISGLSMGGQGALYLAIRHQDTFGACGSTSGGVDIRPFPLSWNMNELLGDRADNPQIWDEHSIVNLTDRIRPGLKIIIDCGTDDFFYKVNNRLHEELLYRNIPHDYITRPGGHTGEYWKNSIEYQILFFDNFFKQK